MSLFIRSDIDAATIALLRSLHESDIAIVLRECSGGSEAGVEHVISTQLMRDQRDARSSVIPIPKELSGSDEKEAWSAAVHESAEECRPGNDNASTLDETLPRVLDEHVRLAQTAEGELAGIRQEIARYEGDLDELGERSDLHFARFDRSKPLMKFLRRWHAAEAALWLLESLVVFGVCAAYFGVFDMPKISSIPFHTWVQVAAVSLPCVVTTFVLAMAAAWLVEKLAPGKLLFAFATLLTLGGMVVFGIALGVLRWSASFSALDLDANAVALGSNALLVIVTVTSLVVACAAVVARTRISRLNERFMVAERSELHFSNTQARLCAHRDALQQRLVRLESQVQAPDSLRAIFERGVKLVVRQLRDEDAVVADRVAQAQSAFRYLSQLSGPVREAIITNLYELRGIKDTEEVSGSAKAGHNGARHPLHLAGFLLAVCLGVGSSTGCSETPPSHTLLVACDGTGVSPDDVCNASLLTRANATWSAVASTIPGSTFQVVTSAGSFSETVVHDATVVPDRWEGDVRVGSVNWRRQGIQAVEAIPIPVDDPTNPSINQSDLISLLTVSSRRAEESPENVVELLVASDGWLISNGFDARKTVPTSEQVLARLETSGVTWDLSVFSTTTICGFHNQGTTAAKAEARETLWRELFVAGNGPVPTIRASCRDLYPPVPTQLLNDEMANIGSNSVLEEM